MRTETCVDCGVEFQTGERGRPGERCPIHRQQRKSAMTQAARERRPPCRHPDGCPKPPHWDGWCGMHAYRVNRYGEPGPAGRIPARERYQYETGYVLVRVGRGRGRKGLRYEHHVVMEQVLGRPLRTEENVHHINGVRDDNRPENLELWTKSQPPGQRVTDKVAWAVELLELYAPELLASKPTQLRLLA